MPKYISRKFVNGRWQYEYENSNRPLSRQKKVGPGAGLKIVKRGVTGRKLGSGSTAAIKRLHAKSPTSVARKRVMSSTNRMNSEINGVRKGYGAIVTAAKNHERRVRESAGSAYRRDVDDSRGNGGGLRRMTQKENMRSLTRWRQQVAVRRGKRLQKQGATTDSGHRTSGGAYSHRAHTNTAKSPSTARGRAVEHIVEKHMRKARAHNESDSGYKTSIRNENQAKTAMNVENKKRADQWSRYKRHYNTAVRTGKEIITPRKRVQKRISSRGRGTR